MSNKTLGTYLNLCTQVYDLSKPSAPHNEYEFYRSYALKAKGSILEPMCGTGRFLLPLFEEGFNIEGFDASDHMLKVLHNKARNANLSPKVWKSFIADFNGKEKYDLIIIPSGSFGLITDLGEAINALQIFYDHLSEHGTLLFEIETLKAIPSQFNTWRSSAYSRDDEKVIIANFLNLSVTDNVLSTICKYELVENHNISNTEIEMMKVRYYDPQILLQLIKSIGFKEYKMAKAFVLDSIPDKNDEVVVFECKK